MSENFHSPSSPLDLLGFPDHQILHLGMASPSNQQNSSPTSDDVSTELFDSSLLLDHEAPVLADDDELLKPSSWSPKLNFHENSSDFHPSTSFDKGLSHSDLSPTSSQGLACFGTMDTLHSENNKLSSIKKGAGLVNLGNTCFMNAVLQCCIHTVPLLGGMLLDNNAMCCQCSEEVFCVLCVMRELVELSLTSTAGPVEPWKLVNNLSYFLSSFQRFQQEDAHEFLQCFLEKLESCYASKLRDAKYSESKNLVNKVFGGCLVSKVKCCYCGHCSDTYEASVDLSLEIEDADNLLAALQSFTKVEFIEDLDNKFTCEMCNDQVPIEKQLKFDRAPSVAAFHLKRFKTDGCFVEKIDKHVAFPLELDLLPFTRSEDTYAELKYSLYAIIVHIGLNSTSGHYYCFIRLSPHVWVKYDDSRVVQVHEDFVLSQEAYILFYAQEGTSWFSGFLETQKFFLESDTQGTSPKSVLDKLDVSTLSPTLSKTCSSDSNEAIDASESKYDELDADASVDNLQRSDIIETNKDNDYQNRNSVTEMPVTCNSFHEFHKKAIPCTPDKVHQDLEFGLCSSPRTPLRSSSPELYREDPPAITFSIQRDLRPGNPTSCKRRLNKGLDDMEARLACSLIKKSIPGSRAKQLFSALKVCESEMKGLTDEGSRNRKKSRKFDHFSS